MYLSVIYCCYHFFYQHVGGNILFDKFPCHLQRANTKISVKQKAINTNICLCAEWIILTSYMNCSYDFYFADYYAVMPPYDMFLSLDKASRVKHFFQVNIYFYG